MACGCAESCNCFLIDSESVSVTGSGTAADPYIATVVDTTCVADSDTIDFEIDVGGCITGEVRLDPAAGNQISASAAGLYVPPLAGAVAECDLPGEQFLGYFPTETFYTAAVPQGAGEQVYPLTVHAITNPTLCDAIVELSAWTRLILNSPDGSGFRATGVYRVIADRTRDGVVAPGTILGGVGFSYDAVPVGPPGGISGLIEDGQILIGAIVAKVLLAAGDTVTFSPVFVAENSNNGTQFQGEVDTTFWRHH